MGQTLEKLFYDCELNGSGNPILAVATRLGVYGGLVRNAKFAGTGGNYCDFVDMIGTRVDGIGINSVSGVTFLLPGEVATVIRDVVGIGPSAGTTASDNKSSDAIFLYHTESGTTAHMQGCRLDGWRSGFWINVSGEQPGIRITDCDFLNCGHGVRVSSTATTVGSVSGLTFSGCFDDIDNPEDLSISQAAAMRSATATTTQLADISATINTSGKYEGRCVFNINTNKPVWAAGAATSNVWLDATGATAHTPV